MHRYRYGQHPSQFADLWLPDAPDTVPAPVAVLLHGGWWRDLHDLTLMDPLARDLTAAGWAVWNVEYRRTGADGGGWPQTVEDVAAALRLLATTAAADTERLDAGRVAAVGHSAGGHLALLTAAASPVTRVVALAPVTDLARSDREGLGEGAVAAFLGASPGEDAPRDGSPVARPETGFSQLVVHGDADQRVPVDQSRDYVVAARAAGAPVTYEEVPGADHFAVIDPDHPAWRTARAWLLGSG
ncbi:alpha/beta hydrolase family protein [Spiractinospora alimapuensis]|uniref:alpha/beta hydrolase family protein n=1 Tax=Spiractinospora alimapuensis TaxID=2820884 RepID=UPI003743BEBA